MPTIRAYGASERMAEVNTTRLDENQKIYLTYMTTNRWVSVRLETLGGLMIFAAAAFAVLARHSLGGQSVGLSLSYALSITAQLNLMVRMSTEAENAFNSVERIQSYATMPTEAAAIVTDHRPPQGWPSAGKISIKGLEMKYRPDLPPVIPNLSIEIAPGEKIGVVGRTGAGKSSLFQALFRIVEPSRGSVEFDGMDIAMYGG